MTHRDIEDLVEELARDQHGVASRTQALGAGATASLIDRRLRTRQWERLDRGAFRVLDGYDVVRQVLMARILTRGPGAVASHAAAAHLLGLDGSSYAADVMIPRRPGAAPTVHHTRHLPAADVTSVEGIPCTTLARTVVDLGAVLDPASLERAAESAFRKGLSPARLRWQVDSMACRGRAGPPAVRRMLGRRPPGVRATESELETRFVQLAAAAGLPEPVRQYALRRDGRFVARVDFAWPDRCVFVELDGSATHAGPDALDHDLARQNRLVRFGLVLRFTWRQVVTAPEATIAELRSALGERAG